MLKTFKTIVLTLLTITLFFNITVNAQTSFSLELPKEFYNQTDSKKEVSNILGVSESDLDKYLTENNVFYLAVNKDNSKQIKITVNENEFSNSVVNLSNLSDDKILSLREEISGIENLNGDVINLKGQKFLKIELSSNDSGGEYILTQYITACDRKSVIISFYTDSSLDTDYILETFESISSPMFIREENATIKAFSAAIPWVTIAFILICVALGGSIIIDIKQQRNADDEEEDYEENPDLEQTEE